MGNSILTIQILEIGTSFGQQLVKQTSVTSTSKEQKRPYQKHQLLPMTAVTQSFDNSSIFTTDTFPLVSLFFLISIRTMGFATL